MPTSERRVVVDEASDRLRVTELFYSLQGESVSAGIPTVFVRLTGCPLRCSYCDTEYAFTGGEWMTCGDILSRVADYACDYVTVTGGEPLAQRRCFDLLIRLCDAGYRVSVETGGAHDISAIDPRVTRVMDLKTPASGECERNLYSNMEWLRSRDQVKMVICGRDDYEWAKRQLVKHRVTSRCEVLFSPAWQRQNATELAEWILADRLPVRLQLQLHKFLWGDVPGR